MKWLTDVPKWVEQWPLPKEKLEALEQLVKEQLQSGHIEPSMSPWNSPVFVIKKKSGKWMGTLNYKEIYENYGQCQVTLLYGRETLL